MPEVVILPILLVSDSVNQSAPSGPAVMPLRPFSGPGSGYSVTTPVVVIRPILGVPFSVNQSAPSGPEVMSQVNVAVGEGKEYSVIAPKVVILPITRPSVNRKRLTGLAPIFDTTS